MIIGVDAGNYETKIVHAQGHDCFRSSIGEWRKRKSNDIHSSQDMEFEILNKYEHFKGFAGPLANIESDYGGDVWGNTKNHPDAITRILLAIHRNMTDNEIYLVVGQPYTTHTDDEKNDIIKALRTEHSVTINDEKKVFSIKDVKVGIEGAMAFLSFPKDGPCNVIDIGSGTVNCIHFLNKKIVDRKCDTLPFGSETSKISNVNYEAMASGIFKRMSGVWNKSDPTYICGGISKLMVQPLNKYYPKAQLMQPMFNLNGIKLPAEPKYSNAIGLYEVGAKVFGKLQIN